MIETQTCTNCRSSNQLDWADKGPHEGFYCWHCQQLNWLPDTDDFKNSRGSSDVAKAFGNTVYGQKEWEATDTDQRAVKWNKEQSEYLLQKLAANKDEHIAEQILLLLSQAQSVENVLSKLRGTYCLKCGEHKQD